MMVPANISDIVREAPRDLADWVRQVREDIHAHPELRYQERRTAELCAAQLESDGIEVRRGVGQTGVVGLLRGGRPGPTVAFRAEMDALAMDDLCGADYASRTTGVAHLCGHDGHVAALLGCARLLSRLREHLHGNVKFLFEPAEEATPPGEIPGSLAMIEDGALEDPEPSAIYGAHFYPDCPAGAIALRAGASFSGNDAFTLTIRGVESHSAVPSAGIDAIVVGAHVITAIQSFAARELDVEEAASLTVGTISGGRMSNLLAAEVVMTGTMRISSETIRDTFPEKIERVVRGVCDSFGAEYDLKYKSRSLPAVVCTLAEVEVLRAAAKEVLGSDGVIEMRHPRLAADTIHHWFAHMPGAFFMVGTASSDPATRYPSHHQRFNIAPETWEAVVAAEAMTAIRYLEKAGTAP